MYRQRFGLSGYPLPQNAQGKTFFDKSPGFKKLERAFRQLIADPGLGVLTADAGVGKTAALRHLCSQLPKPDPGRSPTSVRSFPRRPIRLLELRLW